MTLNSFQSEQLLAEAFDALFDYVVAIEAGLSSVSGAPVFSYLLTPKQQADVERVCRENHWPIVNCPGILIDVNAVRHPITARRTKDQITDAEIKAILRKAYSPRSLVRANREHGQQALIFNTHQKVLVGNTTYHGLAVLEIRSTGARNYLAPVTCYHATEAKVRAIQR